MAKRALLSRLSRLELPGRKPKAESAPAVKHPVASLELKTGEHVHRLPSAKAVQEEKVQLEKIKKVETREKALRIIEKFREKERLERAETNDRHWRADESDRTERQDQAVEKMDRSWRIARIAWRLVFGLTMIYFGLRGLANLINFILYPPARAAPISISGIWFGVAFVFAGWLFQWARRKLEPYEWYDWVPYVRVAMLAWIPMLAVTAMLFLGRVITPSLEAFIRLGYVYLYVTLLACWYYFLTIV